MSSRFDRRPRNSSRSGRTSKNRGEFAQNSTSPRRNSNTILDIGREGAVESVEGVASCFDANGLLRLLL